MSDNPSPPEAPPVQAQPQNSVNSDRLNMLEGFPSKLLTILIPYGALISIFYLFGYWSSFGVDILAFVGVSDIVKLGIYPIVAGGALFLILGYLGGSLRRLPLPLTEEERDKIIKIDLIVSIGTLVIVIGFATLLYFQGDPYFWQFTGLLVAGVLVVCY